MIKNRMRPSSPDRLGDDPGPAKRQRTAGAMHRDSAGLDCLTAYGPIKGAQPQPAPGQRASESPQAIEALDDAIASMTDLSVDTDLDAAWYNITPRAADCPIASGAASGAKASGGPQGAPRRPSPTRRVPAPPHDMGDERWDDVTR